MSSQDFMVDAIQPYPALCSLTDKPDLLAILSDIKAGKVEQSKIKFRLLEYIRGCRPATPFNRMIVRDSFWYKLADKAGKCRHLDDVLKVEEFAQEFKKNKAVWPPKPVYVTAWATPQPTPRKV